VLVAAACCPHPPLLVPEVAQGAAGHLDAVREACTVAVDSLLASGPEVVVILGSGPAPGHWPTNTGGTLAGHGVDVRAGGTGPLVLPLPQTVGAWLLDRAGWTGPRAYVAVSPGQHPADAEPGLLAGPEGERTGVLCMADGSAKRSPAAPGHLDARAEGHDAAVARAWAAGDAAALANLDAGLAAQLWVGGSPAWRALGTAALARSSAPLMAVLLHESAPLGVGYLVATWTWP